MSASSPNKVAAAPAGDDQPQPFPPPLVPDTLQYRLDVGNIGKMGGQRGSLTRCAQKFGTFQSKLVSSSSSTAAAAEPHATAGDDTTKKEDDTNAAANTKTTTTTTSKFKDDLSLELELYRIEATKLLLSIQNTSVESKTLSTEYTQTQSIIEREQALVEQLQQQLHHSLQMKNCHLEYEVSKFAPNTTHTFTQ